MSYYSSGLGVEMEAPEDAPAIRRMLISPTRIAAVVAQQQATTATMTGSPPRGEDALAPDEPYDPYTDPAYTEPLETLTLTEEEEDEVPEPTAVVPKCGMLKERDLATGECKLSTAGYVAIGAAAVAVAGGMFLLMRKKKKK